MKLNKQLLKEILLNRPTKKLWENANASRELLQMHVLGSGLDTKLAKLDQFENDKAAKLRKTYAKSNRDLFARILRPVDNIWKARGGGVFYNIPTERDKILRSRLQDVRNGHSVRAWARTFWRPRYIDDPMGVLFMEVKAGVTYPTYKSSSSIHEALPSGRGFEYIIFKTEDPKVFRVVDDVLDKLYEFDGEKVLEVKGKDSTFPNYFDRVPALIVSDISRDGREDFFASPIQDEIELADKILRHGSVSEIYRLKQGFPKPWKYPEVCGSCKGQKVVNGSSCDKCNGSGIKLTSEPGDVSVFAWPTKEQPEITEKAGFTSPDLQYLEYSDGWLRDLEDLINFTHWGSHQAEQQSKTSGEKTTATQSFIDVQPVENRLSLYAESAENVEKWITNRAAEFYFNIPSADIAAVNYGRRFLIEGPDVIWTKYSDARKNGAPQATLTEHLEEYIETKYQGNPQELEKWLKLSRLEPGVHLDMGQAKNALPYGEYIKKLFFLKFVSQLPPMKILNTPLMALDAELEKFTAERIAALPEDPALAAARELAAAGGPGGGDPGAKPPGKPAPKPAPQPA